MCGIAGIYRRGPAQPAELPRVVEFLYEPCTDAAAVPAHLVARAASATGRPDPHECLHGGNTLTAVLAGVILHFGTTRCGASD